MTETHSSRWTHEELIARARNVYLKINGIGHLETEDLTMLQGLVENLSVAVSAVIATNTGERHERRRPDRDS